MRRSHAVAVLLLTLVLTACTVGAPPQPAPAPVPTPQPEPTLLVVGVEDLPSGFNPHLLAHHSPVTTALGALVLPSVFRPDERGTLRLDPTIATSAAVVSTAPFTVSYELNLEASWSSNAPIAAEDFVYLWERMRGEPGVADAAGYRLITEVRSRAGGKAVDVVFSEPYPAWQGLFADLLPAHILKDAPGSWVGALAEGLPASGGPFRIQSVDRARGEVVIARNDLYWDTPAVLDRLAMRELDDAATAAGLASGDVDVALSTADSGIRAALDGLVPPPRVQPAPQPTVVQLGMRSDGGPLADPRARRAIGALVDREAVRAAVAPGALPADAFGPAPSAPGYLPTAPPGAPARPDPVAAEELLTAAGWVRNPTTGGWSLDGVPVRLVLGVAAGRAEDLRVARVVAGQLVAAGVDVSVVAPTGVQLFGQETVPATPPSTSATPVPTAASGTPTPTPTPTPTRTNTAPGGLTVDLMVLPRTAGGDPGTELASDYGCPQPNSVVPDPPRSPTGFCFPPLQPLLDELVSATPRPGTAAVVESVLWSRLPVLPLFQPVTLVVSTPESDAITGIGPGPLQTGPLTGAQRWRPPTR